MSTKHGWPHLFNQCPTCTESHYKRGQLVKALDDAREAVLAVDVKYETLLSENARLREALQNVRNANPNPDLSTQKYRDAWKWVDEYIQAALEEKQL